MQTSAQAKKQDSFDVEMMSHKRQEKALREFKEVLEDLVLMMREASGMQTVYLYWINRERRQFVMETKSTVLDGVVFQDRLQFEDHFLDEYKDIREPVSLEVGSDISREQMKHYYRDNSIQYITLLPFVNNDETVAITVAESGNAEFSSSLDDVVYAYINALGNVLNTYLEISDLYGQQNEWVEYEKSLNFLDTKGHFAGLLQEMLNSMQGLLDQGGVSLLAKGMGDWLNVLNSAEAHEPAPLGLPVEQRSVARDALNNGEPEFAIHFNRNPKRISPREPYTEGATLAIPVLFNDYRKAVVVVYEENPLVFKESTKHKLVNMVRLTGLKIQAKVSKAVDDSLLTNDYRAFIPDLWERAINAQVKRLQHNQQDYHTWVGMVTLSELSQIRTQLRIEELEMMQKDLVRAFNPNNYGTPGLVGFHSDYIYPLILQSRDEQAFENYTDQLMQQFQTPVQLTNGKQIRTGLTISSKKLDADCGDSYAVISEIKRGLSNR